ncbi:hypothetical protein [Nitrosomonas ureae]|uniref:Uncharacterized protein n=1 Tax=Nitrosomonas ureae TaxID=44577 RepID=A0A1H9GGJ4_9PROT|nr:hypothetical protein [Nitrosomonas ureae]PTQ88071.1 hypothetical protein C8R28_100271 [Nitrosomonas ureae]SDT84074.1 hypothetical protein SAMN05216406_101115 [Nitrosomonas ureae]SEQ49214.1 hypothetical protein SAMN05421510_106314 [Nitrosomonas ureae]
MYIKYKQNGNLFINFHAMQFILLLLFFVFANVIWANTEALDQEAQIRELEKTLTLIQQESQSTYQQFLMIQELRRNEMAEVPQAVRLPNSPSQSIPIPNYEDLIQLKQEKQERIDKYTTDLDHLYARYRELEDEKQAIFEQIRSLAKKPEE